MRKKDFDKLQKFMDKLAEKDIHPKIPNFGTEGVTFNDGNIENNIK